MSLSDSMDTLLELNEVIATSALGFDPQLSISVEEDLIHIQDMFYEQEEEKGFLDEAEEEAINQ